MAQEIIITGDDLTVSDGYHTIDELYEHRTALFQALITTTSLPTWKSRLHSDGTMFDKYFIAGIGINKGEQITYHLPIEEWDNTKTEELPNAPEWDGHTSWQVISRLKEITK